MVKKIYKPKKIDRTESIKGISQEEKERIKAFQAVLEQSSTENGRKTDMTKMVRKKPRHWGRIIFFLSLSLIALASVAGYFYFTSAEKFTGSLVRLNLEVSEQVASGGETTLTIFYENGEAVTLREAQLAVRYPDGFTYLSADIKPSNEGLNAFELGDIKPGVGKQLEIRGRIVGDVGSQSNFDVTLSYVPATFNSEFLTEASKTITITDTTLGLVFDGSQRAIPDNEITYTIDYENASSEAIRQARISLEIPEAFVIRRTEPETEGIRSWTIHELEPGETGTITFTGVFSGTAGELNELIVRAGLISTEGTFQLQTEKRLIVQIVQPETSVDLTINGSEKDQTTSLGSTLNYVVSYSNQTDEVLRDMVISAKLEGQVIDWDSLVNTRDAQVEDGTLTWTKDQVDDLAELTPGAEGSVSFSVRVVTGLAIDSDLTNLEIISSGRLEAKSDDLGENLITAETEQITLKVSTQLQLTTEARYYTDDFTKLGEGPLPPVVDQTTKYRLYWYLDNTLNNTEDVSVVATIPPEVFFTGRYLDASVGNIQFQAETRKVIWDISKIPSGTGRDLPSLLATFELSITPGTSDVGSILVLTDATTATGTDAFTESEISVTQDVLTTNLDADQYAQGQGKVELAELEAED
ncbi:MAG: hypothetical protein V1853_01680 [bacterium]